MLVLKTFLLHDIYLLPIQPNHGTVASRVSYSVNITSKSSGSGKFRKLCSQIRHPRFRVTLLSISQWTTLLEFQFVLITLKPITIRMLSHSHNHHDTNPARACFNVWPTFQFVRLAFRLRGRPGSTFLLVGQYLAISNRPFSPRNNRIPCVFLASKTSIDPPESSFARHLVC